MEPSVQLTQLPAQPTAPDPWAASANPAQQAPDSFNGTTVTTAVAAPTGQLAVGAPYPSIFPLYRDLVPRLSRNTGLAARDPAARYMCALASGYAYGTPAATASVLSRLGLGAVRCRQVSMHVSSMLVDSTAHISQSECGRVVVLAYRGTHTFGRTNIWTDLDVEPDCVRFELPGAGRPVAVHAGFYRNVSVTKAEILQVLLGALHGRCVVSGEQIGALESLYITGHSLGGAMATLMSAMIATEPDLHRLRSAWRATYTYGSPMAGSQAFAGQLESIPGFTDRHVRLVNGRDVMVSLPPRGSGDFAHVGPDVVFNAGGWHTRPARGQMIAALGVPLAAANYLADRFTALRRLPFAYSLSDHMMHRYVAASHDPTVPDEFGEAHYDCVPRTTGRC